MATTTHPKATGAAAHADAAGRVLHMANPPMKGGDVKSAQKLLLDNPFGRFDCGEADGEFGPATASATAEAKWALGYPDSNCDEVFGTRLRAFLAGDEKLPTEFANRGKARKLAGASDTHIRQKIVEFAKWGCKHEPEIHYLQSRPMAGLDSPEVLPLKTDCSGFATLCYKWAGGPDPNGRKFCGAGWTGDMAAHGKHIAKSAVKPGDLIVYGGEPRHQHVCIVIEGGADPKLISHGQEKGPFEISFSAETAAHKGQPVYWLSYLH
jgi:cell wall-associated NlpC family hydrolase